MEQLGEYIDYIACSIARNDEHSLMWLLIKTPV